MQQQTTVRQNFILNSKSNKVIHNILKNWTPVLTSLFGRPLGDWFFLLGRPKAKQNEESDEPINKNRDAFNKIDRPYL